MSIYTLVFLGLVPLGSLFSGSISDVGGAPAGLAAAGVVGIISTAAVFLWEKHQQKTADTDLIKNGSRKLTEYDE